MIRATLTLIAFTLAATTYAQGTSALAGRYPDEMIGRRTVGGQVLDETILAAAHRSYPIGTRLEVFSPANGSRVLVDVVDRGPYGVSRNLDLSRAAAEAIGIDEFSTAHVEVRVVDRADGDTQTPRADAADADDPIAGARTGDGGLFTVQMASYRERRGAERAALSLERAWVQEVDVDGAIRYRVNYGLFVSDDAARRALVRLNEERQTGFVKKLEPGWKAGAISPRQ